MAKFKYLLGDASPEAQRLNEQAKLWDPTTHALFDRVRVRRGWRVLEIGPGQGSLHLELRRRVQGPIDAVEPSRTFADNLRARCERDQLGEGRIFESFLIDAPLPRAHYDFIFARWVFLFLPDPLAHVKKLVAALKPGGILAVQDYQRETEALIPRPEEWSNFVATDIAFFATQGGDASIGAKLPLHFKKAGLEVLDIRPEIKTGRPGSEVWTWLSRYFLGIMDRYAEIPPFTKAQAQRLRRHWLAAEKEPTSVMIAPAVIDVVGRKKR